MKSKGGVEKISIKGFHLFLVAVSTLLPELCANLLPRLIVSLYQSTKETLLEASDQGVHLLKYSLPKAIYEHAMPSGIKYKIRLIYIAAEEEKVV